MDKNATYEELEDKTRELSEEITHLKKSIKAISNERTRLLTMLSGGPAVIYACHPSEDYGTTFMSENIQEHLGYTANEFIENQTCWVDNIHPEDKQRVFADLQKLFETGHHIHEYRFKHKDGTYIWVQDELRLIYDADNNPIEIIGYWLDITKRNNAESELEKTYAQLLHAEKLAAIGKLTASIAHEFSNPLTGIQSVIEGIKINIALDEQYQELIDLALSECDRVKGLIESLQDFNKPSSGVRETVDIHSLLDNMILMVKKEFKDSHITIKKQYAPELPMVHIVTDQIKQVFLNLLTNAKDAIDNHSGKVTISTEDLNGEIVVRISDTGSCIAQDILPHIFEPFFTTKSAVKGTGLGLSVSYGIIKGHGGDIQVDSTPGQGTTFSVILPLSEETNEQTESTDS